MIPPQPPVQDRPSTVNRRPFFALYAAAFCSMLGIGIIVPFLPRYAQHVGAGKFFYVGLIFGFMNVSRLIFLPMMRREVESGRRKKRTILIEGLGCYALLSMAYLWSDNPFTLGIVRFFNGFFAVMVIPVSMAIVGELTPKMGEGREMGNFQMAMMGGFGLGPLLGGVLDDLFGYAYAFITMGALNLLALCMVLFMFPDEEDDKATAAPSRQVGPSGPPGTPQVPMHRYREALGSPIVFGVLIFRLINNLGQGASFTFIPILASDPRYLSLSPSRVGLIISTIAMVVGIFSPVFGRLADRFSRVKLVITGSLGYTICIVFMAHCRGFWSLWMVGILMGLFGAVATPAAAAISVVEGRQYGMITVMTLFDMAMSLGLFIGPLIGGLIGDAFGLHSCFHFTGLIGLLGTSVFYLLLRHTDANRPLSQALSRAQDA